jgi:hypothetical protein
MSVIKLIPLDVAYAQDRRFRERDGRYDYRGPTPLRARWAQVKHCWRRFVRWLNRRGF